MRKIIEGDVVLDNLYLKELVDISDVAVKGYFNCNNNNLTNLVGSPHTVDHNFYCMYNDLTSLVGAPSAVGFTFDCRENPLTSIEGIPKTINYHFIIDESLKDEFPEEYIRSLSDIKGRVVYF